MSSKYLDRVEIVTDSVQKADIVVIRPEVITDEMVEDLVLQNPISSGYLCLRAVGDGLFTPAIKQNFVDSFGIALRLDEAMIVTDIRKGKILYMKLKEVYER